MPQQKSFHFNGLNGIRAICALTVVVSHVYLGLNNIGINFSGTYAFALAPYSVTAFFSLSGFLITYLLTQEKEFYGTVAVKKFYLRRILRIWPLYFGYMLIAILAGYFVFHATDFSSAGFYVFFFPNIPFAYDYAGISTVTQILFLGHFWSLGVEEQFYAFYPWLIKLFRKTFVVLTGMLVIMLLVKIITKYWSYKTGNPLWYAWAQSTPFEAMAIGGLGAWLYKEHQGVVLQIAKNKFLQVLITVIIVLAVADKIKLINPFAHILIAVVTVMAIYCAHLFNKPWINLRNRYLDHLGKISYGIYVYHPLVLGLMALAIKDTALQAAVKIGLFFLGTVLFTILIAYLSYNHFEKYFLNLKFKYAMVQSKD